MEDYAAKFADYLEQTAIKVRSLTVDRLASYIRLGGLGILTGTLGFAALIFLVWTIFGALEIPLTTAGAYGVLGSLLLGVGGFLWFTRSKAK